MFHVVLVEPKTPGNVGAAARAMMNFGLTELHLVNPCPLDDEAWERALHARDLLKGAHRYDAFEEVAARMAHLAGFTSETTTGGKRHLRSPLTIEDFAARAHAFEGDVALVFGREDDGLHNDEVARCDTVVTIPTSPEYPSMNLSHAVAVACYQLRAAAYAPRAPRRATARERDTLYAAWDALMDATGLAEHRREHTRQALRRVVGRALPSTWEYHRLMGVLSGALKGLGHWPIRGAPAEEAGDAGDEGDDGGDGAAPGE